MTCFGVLESLYNREGEPLGPLGYSTTRLAYDYISTSDVSGEMWDCLVIEHSDSTDSGALRVPFRGFCRDPRGI